MPSNRTEAHTVQLDGLARRCQSHHHRRSHLYILGNSSNFFCLESIFLQQAERQLRSKSHKVESALCVICCFLEMAQLTVHSLYTFVMPSIHGKLLAEQTEQ